MRYSFATNNSNKSIRNSASMLKGLLLVLFVIQFVNGHYHKEQEDDDGEDEFWGDDNEIDKIEDDLDTLVLTHVVFRHGDRTPDSSSIYPNDPYINETYFPYGKGQLTLQGKQRAYALGRTLRDRYGRFLGDVYYPDVLEGRSSAYPRTQMTLQLVQAGLFPPTKEYKVDDALTWQPIPYSYSDYSDDNLIATFRSCERIFNVADDLEKTNIYSRVLHKYKHIYKYLSQYSGWNVNNTMLTFFIQNTLKTEEEWGFPLPEWTRKVWPEPLKQAASMFWRVMSSTVQLRRMSIGNLLRKIVEDSIAKKNGTLSPEQRKIFLYSGHDFTVVPFLAAFGNYDGSHLPYTAHLIFELHKIEGVYGFKILFQDYTTKEPQVLSLDACGTFCPLDDFIDLYSDHFSTSTDSC